MYEDKKAREAKTYIDGTCLEILLTDKVSVNNVSGVRGVGKSGKKWQAYVTYAGKARYLGKFKSIQEAAAAREKGMEQIKEHIARIMSNSNNVPE